MKRPMFASGLAIVCALTTLADFSSADATTRRVVQEEPNDTTAQIAGNLAMGDTLSLEGNVRKYVRRGGRRGGSGRVSPGPAPTLTDVDRYQITIPQTNQPEAVQFSLTGNDVNNTQLTVVSDQNNNQQVDSDETQVLSISGSRIVRQALQPGAYIITISRTTEGGDSESIPYVAQIVGTRLAPRPASSR